MGEAQGGDFKKKKNLKVKPSALVFWYASLPTAETLRNCPFSVQWGIQCERSAS